jgi:hypothetical protein
MHVAEVSAVFPVVMQRYKSIEATLLTDLESET